MTTYFGPLVTDSHFASRRQCNMDYILISTLRLSETEVLAFYISYDIACSFSINFFRRMNKYPETLQFNFGDKALRWAVPKFHLMAHGRKCQGRYSLNYMAGVGRTHGEGVESNWAITNGFALSTREMSGAGRHETLNDVMGYINWTKTIKIGEFSSSFSIKAQSFRNGGCASFVDWNVARSNFSPSGPQLFRDLIAAVVQRDKQRDFFAEFNNTIPVELSRRWEELVREFEDDPTGTNPYEETETGKLICKMKYMLYTDLLYSSTAVTLKDVQLELAQEEADELARGVMSLHETTASVFLATGIELEEQQ